MNINNNASQLKKDILVKIALMFIEDRLVEDIDRLPIEIIPRDSKSIRCCIHNDREIIKNRIMARLGISVEGKEDSGIPLSGYAKLALERDKPTWPMLTVLDEACNACVRANFMVTNACQACLARPCIVNCPKDAITILDEKRAHIDSSKCINCGLCLKNCPYHAIIYIPVPCEESCPVGAINKNEYGKEVIDYHKCIFCGNCMRECPFGAMMDKGQLIDVLKHLKADEKVNVMYAPAIASQFNAKPGQLKSALLKIGFNKVWEVALGADVTSDKEAAEFEERMERGDKLMTTSCCPAYVKAVRKHVPELIPCVSETRTPMHYTAEMMHKDDPDAINVFIGPCLAKRREGLDDELVDYGLSMEELDALFIATGTDVSKEPDLDIETVPTASGRKYAMSGGVAEAVKVRLKHPEKLKAAVINGLDKDGMKQLKGYGKVQAGETPITADTPNLVEVMACNGGCVGGPCVVKNPKAATVQLQRYAATGKEVKKD
ncbi:4Fe-4S dicluster domain-containing protein [Brachyspira hampsonii]|uniref:Fe-hydrogenase large subunit family protein n=1 Tax=Brachyspira hampsonii TaxID=1287055 RepID=A0AAC9TST2_9SPIR|nr:4Fe-4S dicluster domain-containing protein [Brachyspira hampsonii]ASJ20512.1 Fe-hydrogenase large subunit family protein [Brachyspira hampsonii]ELV05897.1 iron only hydrogenase large subunit [Brachyspira hampsonii 30599]MBW5379393.1 4Fe-4S dicluster domain-containing protein [Brachyspira hampsonii]OEJ18292.1 Fe-hydrogenase large subunit family protein [Brachyspira hampsonii]